MELGIIKARGFSHVSVSLKLYLWVACAALTIVHWLQFYPKIFYINIGLAQGSVLSPLPPLFYIFLQSSHSFSSLITTLLCITEQRSGDWYIKGTYVFTSLPPALTMLSCLSKHLPLIPGFTSACLFVYWILSAPSHLSWANFWSFPSPSALPPVRFWQAFRHWFKLNISGYLLEHIKLLSGQSITTPMWGHSQTPRPREDLKNEIGQCTALSLHKSSNTKNIQLICMRSYILGTGFL